MVSMALDVQGVIGTDHQVSDAKSRASLFFSSTSTIDKLAEDPRNPTTTARLREH
jgi:hypothetical protein